MSGGAWEYMASYVDGIYGDSGFDSTSISKYDTKYFDIYPYNSLNTNYKNRILGDATGELGPFYLCKDSDSIKRYCNFWFKDNAYFINPNYPWFARSGHYSYGVRAGQFFFHDKTGSADSWIGFRLVLK